MHVFIKCVTTARVPVHGELGFATKFSTSICHVACCAGTAAEDRNPAKKLIHAPAGTIPLGTCRYRPAKMIRPAVQLETFAAGRQQAMLLRQAAIPATRRHFQTQVRLPCILRSHWHAASTLHGMLTTSSWCKAGTSYVSFSSLERRARIYFVIAAASSATLHSAATGCAPVSTSMGDSDCQAGKKNPCSPLIEIPGTLVGRWVQDFSACESMWPFLHGLGVPYVAARLADLLQTTLEIRKCKVDGVNGLEITDYTLCALFPLASLLNHPNIMRCCTQLARTRQWCIWMVER
eukprot:SAG31_NODE_258_length_18937_cov_61.688555_3_plen_292_part_00